mmetsp:Transcript_92836/g.300250  ORF Transcript_92836/g.300250 Transcript_92836/m.300250 type:complete len:312 (-) Transcript_92836:1143-2078(-)
MAGADQSELASVDSDPWGRCAPEAGLRARTATVQRHRPGARPTAAWHQPGATRHLRHAAADGPTTSGVIGQVVRVGNTGLIAIDRHDQLGPAGLPHAPVEPLHVDPAGLRLRLPFFQPLVGLQRAAVGGRGRAGGAGGTYEVRRPAAELRQRLRGRQHGAARAARATGAARAAAQARRARVAVVSAAPRAAGARVCHGRGVPHGAAAAARGLQARAGPGSLRPEAALARAAAAAPAAPRRRTALARRGGAHAPRARRRRRRGAPQFEPRAAGARRCLVGARGSGVPHEAQGARKGGSMPGPRGRGAVGPGA